LSYRALDVEQIGYVYEGLLGRTVKRTAAVTLELDGTKNAKTPWIGLAELESARLEGAERLAELLQERSGGSASRVRNDLGKPVTIRLSIACRRPAMEILRCLTASNPMPTWYAPIRGAIRWSIPPGPSL